jgi:hypothetical protein
VEWNPALASGKLEYPGQKIKVGYKSDIDYTQRLLDFMKEAQQYVALNSVAEQIAAPIERNMGNRSLLAEYAMTPEMNVSKWLISALPLHRLTFDEVDSVLAPHEVMELKQKAAQFLRFFLKVRPHGDWDLKNRQDFIDAKYPRTGVVLAGRHYKHDVVGNILYGYAGASAGFSPSLLRKMAGLAQLNDDRKTKGRSSRSIDSYFDDPRDQKQIEAGIRLFALSQRQLLTPRLVQQVLDELKID